MAATYEEAAKYMEYPEHSVIVNGDIPEVKVKEYILREIDAF